MGQGGKLTQLLVGWLTVAESRPELQGVNK